MASISDAPQANTLSQEKAGVTSADHPTRSMLFEATPDTPKVTINPQVRILIVVIRKLCR